MGVFDVVYMGAWFDIGASLYQVVVLGMLEDIFQIIISKMATEADRQKSSE